MLDGSPETYVTNNERTNRRWSSKNVHGCQNNNMAVKICPFRNLAQSGVAYILPSWLFFTFLSFRTLSEKTAKFINAKPEHKMYV